MSRREVGQRVARKSAQALLWYAGLRAAGALDSVGADWMYGKHDAEVEDFIAPEQVRKSKEGWLVFTGMGTASGKSAAKYLHNMLPQPAPISWVEYDPSGIDKKAIGHKMAQHALRLEKAGMKMSFAKLSAGHPAELASSFYLREQEHIAIRPQRELILSSPTTAQNIKGGPEQIVSDVLSASGDKGGLAEAEIGGGLQIIRDFFETGDMPFDVNFNRPELTLCNFLAAAHKRAQESQPIKLWLSLNEVIHEAEPEQHIESLADLRIGTHSLFIGSEDDTVIAMPGAYYDCADVYMNAGLQAPRFCNMPQEGHANIVAAAENITVHNWLIETGPPAPWLPI
jgi:nucleoside diphosphate kinase